MTKTAGAVPDLENIFKELWPEIYRFIYYKVQNREEAEELTQDTFKRVLPRLQEQLVKEEKIRPYVFQAARNLLTDTWRRRGRLPEMMDLDSAPGIASHDPDMAQKEEKIVLEEAMTRLSPVYREVLTWRIVKGYPVKDVAQKMERSPGAIRSLQYRAIQSLKEVLEERGFFDES